MKYIKTTFNLKLTNPFEKGPDGQPLITEPGNVVFRGQKIISIIENPDNPDESMIPYEPMKHGENVTVNEIPNSGITDYIANCYGILYRKGNEIGIKIPIQYNKNKTKAYLLIFPEATGKIPSIEELNALSYYLGISQQVSSERIQSALNSIKPQELLKTRTPLRILFASGFDQTDGWARYFILKIKPEVQSGEIQEDGSINYRERRFIHQVSKGTPIAEEVPAQEASDGLDIFGETIKGRLLKHKEYKIGKNISPARDNALLLVSDVDGSLTYRAPHVEVNEKVYIASDINYSTGNIEFKGTVEIKGNVISGFKVISGADCIIHENIDEGSADVKGDLYVKGGIHGSEKSMINIGGSLTAKYIRNGNLHCEGNIFVEDSIINSKIMCRGKVTVISKKSGRILGGEIIGKQGISVNTVGSQTGTDTFLGARMDLEISEQIYFNMSKLKELSESKKEITESLYQSFGPEFMTNPKEYIKSLPSIRKKQCVKLLSDLNGLNQKVKEFQYKVEDLKEILKTPDETIIEVLQRLYPPTRIQMKESIVKIEKKENQAKFRIPPGRAEIEVIYT